MSFLIDYLHEKICIHDICGQHRFYGQSIPFGSIEKAMKNTSVQGCFTSAQALADYAAIILHLKKNLSAAENSPVIVFGCSYAGSKLHQNLNSTSIIRTACLA